MHPVTFSFKLLVRTCMVVCDGMVSCGGLLSREGRSL